MDEARFAPPIPRSQRAVGALKDRLFRLAMLVCLLLVGATLVRGITEMLERAVYGVVPAAMPLNPGR